MLELDGVDIRQGDFRLRADLTVPQGARLAVMGPSGSGKSTLLAALAGFAAHDGAIRWQGAPIHRLPPSQRPLTILFQDHNLLPNLTAFDNVALGIAPDLRLAPADRAQVTAALAAVGLEGLEGRRPAELSGGQMGRVALARALLRDRPLLLLDEPFAALGPGLKAGLLDLVARIAADRGLTLLMVTHDPADARRLCPQTLVVDAGRASGPLATDALLCDPAGPLAGYLGLGPSA